MKKIFAMMIVLVLFVMACSNAIKPGGQDNGSFIPEGTSDATGEALDDAMGQAGSVDGMTVYVQTGSDTGKGEGFEYSSSFLENLFFNSDKTAMKQVGVTEASGTVPMEDDNGVVTIVTVEKATRQEVSEGTLTKQEGKKLFKDNDTVEVDYAGYTIYDIKYTAYKEKAAKVPFEGTGDWVVDTEFGTESYLIKEVDNKLYMFEIYKRNDGTYSISPYVGDITAPADENTYTKQ